MPEVPVACSMKPHGNGGAKNWREGCQQAGRIWVTVVWELFCEGIIY